MADTIRTRAELVALFADNVLGNISEQDLRDYVKSVHLLTDLDGLITVAKAGGQYTLIQSGIDAATSGQTVLVYPGEYNEAITLKDGVDIVAINPQNTKILRQVTDDNVECHCYLKINIAVTGEYEAFFIKNIYSVIKIDGNVSSVEDIAVNCSGGNLTIKGNITSTTSKGIKCYDNGTITVNNSTLTSHSNVNNGNGVEIIGGTVILQNVKIICTHADAKSIYADSAKDVYCTNVWANRDDHPNITQKISGGFNYDANVQ